MTVEEAQEELLKAQEEIKTLKAASSQRATTNLSNTTTNFLLVCHSQRQNKSNRSRKNSKRKK